MPRPSHISESLLVILLVSALAIALAACKKEAQSTAPDAAPEVQVAQVSQQDLPIYTEWIGTTDGFINATIQARVVGYLLKRNFDEGGFVRKGDLLFEIDPRSFEATLAGAKGELRRAEARLVKTELDVKRDTPLAKAKAISQKDLDDSIQMNAAAKGAVASARAEVEQAQLNLSFTRIEAPIDGVTGIAKAQIGDLVGPTTGPLTSISTVDPIRVYFPISEQEYLHAADKVQARYKDPNKQRDDKLELLLSDGSIYPHKGNFLLADRQVDVKTGTIRVAAVFPNPGNILRPGFFARVRAVTKTKQGALLVPQRAITELQGQYQLAVVSPDNTIEIRSVKVGERAGNLWVIDQGLQPGERVVVEGLQKVKAGMVVNPKPFQETPKKAM
ncbi:MAG TPA: efflux RND transporter periplasmic adaptor subunit [Nitrospiraceae bacterium]|nr:efflux RND transporter periplasmic adaptor subunit [Nitrospiraceae bacterium]